jgi:Zn-dependent M16 (insulinase) family peptidase
MLTLNQNERIAVFENGIVNLFSFFNADLAGKLWDDLKRLENILAQYLEHRHNKSVLCRFFRCNLFLEFDDTVA